MRAKKGGASPAPPRSKRDGDPEAPSPAVCAALVPTLHLLARRLDYLLDDNVPDDVGRDMQRLRALTDEVLELLGSVTTTRPHVRAASRPGLGVALRRLGADFARIHGTLVDVRVSGAVDDLPQDVVEVLFDVARETFLNIERHGRATIVFVTLAGRESSVVLDVRDDGLDLGHREAYDWEAGTKMGLMTIAELASSVGGRAVVASGTPRGLRLVVEVPRRPVWV